MSDKIDWRRILTVAALVGALGWVTAVLMVVANRGDPGAPFLPGRNGGLHAVATIGATLAGIATAWAFGCPGPRGWALAWLGGALATALGAALAGTLMWPGLGTMMGPLAVAEYLWRYPLVTLGWALGIAGLHGLVLALYPRPASGCKP